MAHGIDTGEELKVFLQPLCEEHHKVKTKSEAGIRATRKRAAA